MTIPDLKGYKFEFLLSSITIPKVASPKRQEKPNIKMQRYIWKFTKLKYCSQVYSSGPLSCFPVSIFTNRVILHKFFSPMNLKSK